MSGAVSPLPDGRERWWVPWALGAGATLIFFAPLVLAGGQFLTRDMHRVYLPVRMWLRARLWAGEVPTWFPGDGLGEPLWGALVTGLMHPLTLLELVLPLQAGFTLHVLSCFVLAFVGARTLARRVTGAGPALLAAVAYAFCGHVVGMSNNLSYLMSAATLPWSLWAVVRWVDQPSGARLAAAAVALAALAWAGDPLSFAVGSLAVVPAIVARGEPSRARWVPALAVLTAVLAAAPLLPALAIAPAAAGGENHLGDAVEWSAHPLRMLEWLGGPLFASREPGSVVPGGIMTALLGAKHAYAWSVSQAIGALPLALAVSGLLSRSTFSRPVAAWAGAWGVVVALWLGRFTPLYPWLFEHVPAFRSQRYPEKLGAFVALGVVMLAARGLEAATATPGKPRRWPIGLAVIAVVLLLAAVGASHLPALLRLGWPALSEADAALVGSRGREAAGLGLVALAVGAAALAWTSGRRAALAVAVAQFLTQAWALEGTVAWGSGQWMAAPPEILAGLTPVAGVRLSSKLPGAPASLREREARIALEVATLASATPAAWGFESRDTYLPSASRRVRLLTDFEGFDELFGVRYRLETERQWGERPEPRPAVIARVPALHRVLTRLEGTAPPVSLAAATCVAGPEEARDAIARPDFHGGDRAVVECEAPRTFTSPVTGTVRELERRADHLRLQVETGTGGVVVINDAWYPGWRATVDGAEVPVLMVNAAVRGVEVGPGTHHVALTFTHPGLAMGLTLSALGALVSGGLGLRGSRRGAGRNLASTPPGER